MTEQREPYQAEDVTRAWTLPVVVHPKGYELKKWEADRDDAGRD